MWKVGVSAAVAALVVVALAIQFRSRGHRAEALRPGRAAVQPLSPAVLRKCARNVLNDWVRDSVIDGHYPRACYRAALARSFGGDMSCANFYGGSLCEDLKAASRNSG